MEQEQKERRFEEIIGEGPALGQVLEHVELVAPTDASVLSLGETGTGKELIARAIHKASLRMGRSFIKVIARPRISISVLCSPPPDRNWRARRRRRAVRRRFAWSWRDHAAARPTFPLVCGARETQVC
ncbi:MAG: sigma 54-interacting transcriptional regulator [Acidobacteriaceae bacterium]|nr:sigma 54-interacting transcriptional regulator [Acidobacteriaceae bacterium]